MAQKQENQDRSLVNAGAQTKFNQLYSSNNRQNQYYAPFLAKAKRFASCKYIQQNPPIGAYNFPSCFDKKKSPLEDKVSHFILDAQKKKQQMCIFKSSFNRFQKVKKQIPGPASYNLFKNEQVRIGQKKQKSFQSQKLLIDLTRTCPSIPFKENRYGYAIADGKLKTIQKNQEQLQKQKQSRKQYVQTLAGQKAFQRQFEKVNYNTLDLKKKLYNQTQKLVIKQQLAQNQSQKSNTLKKPKIEHLYSSKRVPVEEVHKLLGPGQYQPNNGAFKVNYKNEKFQFFGSTEVRFRDRTNQLQKKGYSLIEMIKQNKKLSQKQQRSPMRKPVHQSTQKISCKQQIYPGPGQYNPSDQLKKRVRGNTFFPHSQRFKQMYPQRKEQNAQQDIDQIKQNQRKSVRTGNLKKDRFKPMHNVYDPVQSSQIRGIVTHHHRHEAKKQSKGAAQRLGSYESQQINSWSRQDKRSKNGNKGYMKQLKQQLAFISDTPIIEKINKNLFRVEKAIKKE